MQSGKNPDKLKNRETMRRAEIYLREEETYSCRHNTGTQERLTDNVFFVIINLSIG